MHKIHGSTLRSVFNEKYRVTITPQMINKLMGWCVFFENYKNNPNVFNTPYLGVEKTFFLDHYQDEIMHIFSIDRKDFAKSITTIETVDLTRNVTSDPFNLFVIWISHLILNTQMQNNLKHVGLITLFKILHYRFFTSLIQQRFRHNADLNVMRATIESLSKKFDIVIYGTWKKTIEARAEDIINEKSIHINTLKSFKEDNSIFYVISDAQTRFRDKINLITQRYYELHKQHKEIGTYETVTEHNGEKVIKDTSGALASMISNITQDMLSVNSFIDNTAIKLLSGMNKELKAYMLKDLIIKFIDMSIYQSKKGQLDDEKMIKGELITIGHRKLLTDIIQVTYRNCINSGINMKNKYEILKTAGNIYRSSQIKDEAVLKVKRSVEYLVNNFPGTKRLNTQLALRINFILYIVLLTLNYL